MDLEKRIEHLEQRLKAMERELSILRHQGMPYSPPYPPDPRQAHMQNAAEPLYTDPYASSSPSQQAYGGMVAHNGAPSSPYGAMHEARPTSGEPARQYGPESPYRQPYPQGQGIPGQPPYPPPTMKKPQDWEHLIARVWLPRIFIVVLLLGVLWGFTAAVSAGYVTEPVRCILGVIAAGLMYWFGERQFRSNREALGQVLQGGAIAVLILSLFAAHQLYSLIPSWLAFVLYICSIACGVFTAVRRHSQTLVIVMTVAGYLIPLLVHLTQPSAWLFAGYEVLFSLAMMFLSLRYSFRGAYFVAIGVLHLPLLYGSLSGDFEGSRYIFMGAIFLQHAVLLAQTIIRPSRHSIDETVSLFAGYGLVLLWIYGLFKGTDTSLNLTPLLVIVWTLAYSFIALWKIMEAGGKTSYIFSSIATVSWFIWLIDILDFKFVPIAITAEGMLALLLGLVMRSQIQRITASVVYGLGICAILMFTISDIFTVETLSWLLLISSLALLSNFMRKKAENAWNSTLPDIFMWANALFVIIFITQITLVLTRALSIDLQHLILSAVWALYAIVVIIYGVVLQKSAVRLAGIILLFITLLKVIFIDLPDVSLAVRAVLFIGLGVVGIAISRLLYKRKTDANADEALSPPKESGEKMTTTE